MLAAATPVDRTETIPIDEADGRVAAAPTSSPRDVPAFDRAAMDGYAVRATDLADASVDRPVPLGCIGDAYTGAVPERPVGPGQCMAIGTGAPLPAGADTVVMVERTSRTADQVTFTAPPPVGQHVARRGADLARGAILVDRGDAIGPARVGGLAAAGLTRVEVFARPSVAVLSTGNEITAPGRPLPPGHVYDVNRFTLAAVLGRHGGTVTPMAGAADSVDALTAALDQAAGHDVIVVSGGSSVGGRDLMLDALVARGEVLFHGVAIKPGKPTLFGRIGRTTVFGMPGNPTSCLSNAYVLLVPFLRKVARLPAWRPVQVPGPLARDVRSTPDRHQFYPVRIVDGRIEPAFKSSGDITSLAGADGYIEIPSGTARLDAGTVVTVTLF